jgi:hypothetical protein
MSSEVAQARPPACFGETDRRDAWWVAPLLTAAGLLSFVVYATFRAVHNQSYHLGLGTEHMADRAYLLSPFYSPLIIIPSLPSWMSPALLILWAPGGFRFTCYYYRKAYYRALFLDPAACGVGEGRAGKGYSGETGLFLVQNLHRYFLYLAIGFLFILSYDVILSCIWPTAGGGKTFGMSVGTLVLLVNVVLLSVFTFSCNSFRHLVGGNLDCFSCSAFGAARYKMWSWVSVINKNHMLWAWLSLFSVGFADFYVWMTATGVFTDIRLF